MSDIYFKNEAVTDDFMLGEFCKHHKLIYVKKQLEQGVWQHRNNIYLLCRNILQPTRDHINAPIRINSGFRNQVVNLDVGGTTFSAHLRALAADISPYYKKGEEPDQETIKGTLKKMRAFIRDNCDYGELILYRTEDENKKHTYTHIHVSLPLWNEDKFSIIDNKFKPSQLEGRAGHA